MKTDNFVICNHPKCKSDDITHTSTEWTEDGEGLMVYYWCKKHAPSDAEEIDWNEIMQKE